MVRVGSFVFCLVSERRLSVVHNYDICFGFVVYVFKYVEENISSTPLWWAFLLLGRVLDLLKCILCICWYDYMIFIFPYSDEVYSIHWFVYINDPCVPMVNLTWSNIWSFFMYLLLDLVGWYFVEDLWTNAYQGCKSIFGNFCLFVLFFVSQSGFGVCVVLASWKLFKRITISSTFCKSLKKIGSRSF